MVYYTVDEYDNFNKPMKKLHTFLVATPNKLTYITKNPIFLKNISLASLECLDEKLVYYEEELFNRIDFLVPRLKSDSMSKVFFDDLQECDLEYQFISKNDLPLNVTINIKNTNNEFSYITNIKTDYNISSMVVYDHAYSEK